MSYLGRVCLEGRGLRWLLSVIRACGLTLPGSSVRDPLCGILFARPPTGALEVEDFVQVFLVSKDAPGTETERGDATRQRASGSESESERVTE